MVSLRRLTGPAAGHEVVSPGFPFRVGRGPANHLRVQEPGVWENHFHLEATPRRGITLHAHPGARTLVNGRPVESVELHLGDCIEAGAARFTWWLSPVEQPSLAWREIFTWIGLGLLAGLQILFAASLPS